MVITTSPSCAAARIAAGMAAISSTKTGSTFPATRSARTYEAGEACRVNKLPYREPARRQT